MIRSALLIALYVNFLTFSLLSVFFGGTGATSFDKLRQHNLTLEANISELESKQLNLSSTLGSLRSNPESIIIEARSLGLYRKGDGVIYFKNFEPVYAVPETDQRFYPRALRQADENILRLFSMAAAVVAFLIFLTVWKARDAHRTNRT